MCIFFSHFEYVLLFVLCVFLIMCALFLEVYKYMDKKDMQKRAKEIYEKFCKSDSVYAVNIDWNIQSVCNLFHFVI
jgi:hypothetical protein